MQMETRSRSGTGRTARTIDHKGPGGRELHAVVKAELTEYLDYSNDVLPLYIVVMVAQGNNEAMVAEDLEVFLGAEQAEHFVRWLFQHLADNPGKYDSTEGAPGTARPRVKRKDRHTRDSVRGKRKRDKEETATPGRADENDNPQHRGLASPHHGAEVQKKPRLEGEGGTVTPVPNSVRSEVPVDRPGLSSAVKMERGDDAARGETAGPPGFGPSGPQAGGSKEAQAVPGCVSGTSNVAVETWCEPCKVLSLSARGNEDHLNSKKHRAILAANLNGGGFCHLCKFIGQDAKIMTTHCAGKRHKERVRRLEQGLDLDDKVVPDPRYFRRCELCSLDIRIVVDWKAHIEGRKHTKKAAAFAAKHGREFQADQEQVHQAAGGDVAGVKAEAA